MSTTNFVETITSDMEFVQHEPYFLYKKTCGEIIGSWFYEQKDFRRITNKIQSIVLKQATPPRRQRCSSDSDSQLKKDDAVQDIMSMLSEAHTEYIKTEAQELIPEKNIDLNDTYSYSKLSNKLMKTNVNNSRNTDVVSSHEKYPVSPRRRFLSTGSYDSTQQFPFPTNKIANELVRQSKETSILTDVLNIKKSKNENHNEDNVKLLPLTLENVENFSAPTRLSPLFSHDEISSPALSGIDLLDQTETTQSPVKPNYFNTIPATAMQKTDINGHYLKSDFNSKTTNDVHSTVLKETLTTHIQLDSDIMLKIHEAYIESLKSLFALKKS